MFTELGFLGSRAPLYIDIIAVAFFLLPILFFYSIRYAILKEIKKHIVTQVIVFVMMLLSVILFEVGMRLAGGFTTYMEASSANYTFFITFLIIHIVTAIIVINTWSYQLITAIKAYRKGNLVGELAANHRRIGKYVAIGIMIVLVQAVVVYCMLFIM
jgi:putative membrane protein